MTKLLISCALAPLAVVIIIGRLCSLIIDWIVDKVEALACPLLGKVTPDSVRGDNAQMLGWWTAETLTAIACWSVVGGTLWALW